MNDYNEDFKKRKKIAFLWLIIEIIALLIFFSILILSTQINIDFTLIIISIFIFGIITILSIFFIYLNAHCPNCGYFTPGFFSFYYCPNCSIQLQDNVCKTGEDNKRK